MADADRTLEILIKLGYVGSEQADAARNALAGIKSETGDLNTSLPEGSELWAKYKNVLSQGGEEISKAGRHMEGLRFVAQRLNGILPGLGMAFSGMVRALGPFMVIGLAIQAAATWWQFYKEKVEAAGKAQNEALDKMRSMTADAIKGNSDFAKSFDDVGSAASRANKALSEAEAILEARLKAQREVTGVNDEAGARQARLALLDAAIAGQKAKENELLGKLPGLQQQRIDTMRSEDWAKFNDLGNEIVAIRAQINDFKSSIPELEQRARTAANVNAIETRGEHAANVVRAGGPAPFVQGVAAAESAYLQGQKLTESQSALLKQFGDYMRDHGATNAQIIILLHLLVASERDRRNEVEAMQRQLANLPR